MSSPIAMTERASRATIKTRIPLDLEAASFVSYLGLHRGHYDPAGGIAILQKARNNLPFGTQGQSMAIGLLISEASVSFWEQNWDALPGSDFGFAALLEALALLQETTSLPAKDFRHYFHSVTDQLQLIRSYTREKSAWPVESETSLLKAEAMVEKLKLSRPKDAIERLPY